MQSRESFTTRTRLTGVRITRCRFVGAPGPFVVRADTSRITMQDVRIVHTQASPPHGKKPRPERTVAS